MRVGKTALIGGVVITAATATMLQAQQRGIGSAPVAASASAPASAAPAPDAPDPYLAQRSARQLLRNGLDYLNDYQDYEHALIFLREAQSRPAGLDAREKKKLADGLARAETGKQADALAAKDSRQVGTKARKPGTSTWASTRRPVRDRLVASAVTTPESEAKAVRKASAEVIEPDEPPSLDMPPLPPAQAKAQAESAVLPPGVDQADAPLAILPSSAPEPRPMPLKDEPKTPVAPAAKTDSEPIYLTGSTPADAPKAPADKDKPPADIPPPIEAPVKTEAPIPVPVPDAVPITPAQAPVTLPSDAPPPIGEAPASVPVPVPVPAPTEPPAVDADELPPLPAPGVVKPVTPAPAPPVRAFGSGLSPETRREVEEIARLQEDALRRNPPLPPGTPAPDDYTAGGVSESGSASRLVLPRPPSPTEARAIRVIPVPEEFVPLPPRQWEPQRKYWAAAATCHMPLYFQDAVLERYGQGVEQAIGPNGRFFSYPLDDPKQSNQRNQLLQPMYSAGMFLGQIALLPYNMLMDPPWEAEYDLGYYRPGDKTPGDTYYLPKTGIGPFLRGNRY